MGGYTKHILKGLGVIVLAASVYPLTGYIAKSASEPSSQKYFSGKVDNMYVFFQGDSEKNRLEIQNTDGTTMVIEDYLDNDQHIIGDNIKDRFTVKIGGTQVNYDKSQNIGEWESLLEAAIKEESGNLLNKSRINSQKLGEATSLYQRILNDISSKIIVP